MNLKEIFDREQENAPAATQEIKDAYEAINCAFEDYLIAVQESSFCFGYEVGRRDALKERREN